LYGIPPVDPALAAKGMAAADAAAARAAAKPPSAPPAAATKPGAAKTAGVTIDQILGTTPQAGGR
jgi:hypothetical protein